MTSMPGWKLSIYVGAVRAQMDRYGDKAEDIVASYTKLTEEEKAEIIAALG